MHASEVQFMLKTEIMPSIAPELALLHPSVVTRAAVNADYDYISITCAHPKNVITEPQGLEAHHLEVAYRIGARHQWLLAKNSPEWRLRRIETLLRLLLRRLSREVATAVR